MTSNAGRLSLAEANRLADSSAVSGAAGAVLALGGNETIGSPAGSLEVALGSGTLTAGGNPTFSGSTTLAPSTRGFEVPLVAPPTGALALACRAAGGLVIRRRHRGR